MYYIFNTNQELEKISDQSSLQVTLSIQQQNILEERFINISPEGYIQYGLEGFENWCKKQNLDATKTILEYLQI